MLKSLELFGFKSFAERTKFDFSPGITAVVGPNGSGKSNVVDGIKWLLGDQSPKSLRGKEMTDVIFNGASGRKPSQLSEATLTFDNTNGFLPIDAPEVQIGRRLWRSGDSEYLINKTPARLKDVRDLLMGTGAGSAAYNIIEQGRVDQILQANASSRRVIFEEAAGISRYKARKVEAHRKLERVDQNLLRLRDMVEELETRLTTLRSQAARAAQFREVSDELRTLWQGLAADDFRRLTRELSHLDEQAKQCQARLDGSSGRQQELENQLAALDAEIAAVEDRLRDVEKLSGTTRETIASHEATIRHQTARQRELEADIVRHRRQRSVISTRARETASELERMREHLAVIDADFTSRKAGLEHHSAAYQSVVAEIESARKSIEEHRQRLLTQMRRVSAAESRVHSVSLQQDAHEANVQRLYQRREALAAQRAATQQRCEQQREHAAAAHAAVAEKSALLRTLQTDRKALAEVERQARRTLAELRETRSAEQAKLGVLEDFDRRQQGLGVGVRNLLDRAESLDYPPWSRIVGTVAELLSADLDHAALLEAALGPRAEWIVIEEFDSLVEYITSESCHIAGRIGFVSCGTELKSAEARAAATGPDLSGCPGVVMRGDRLVGTAEGTPNVPELTQRLAGQLLGETWVVETLETALTLANGIGRGCGFVTLQGERLDPDGSLTVGTPQPEVAIVSRKGELRRIKNGLIDLDHRIAHEDRRLIEFGELLAAADEELLQAEAVAQEAVAHESQQQHVLTTREQDSIRLEQDGEHLNADQDRLQAEQVRLSDERQSAVAACEQAEQELRTLQEALAAAEELAAGREQQFQGLEQQSRAEQLDLAKHEERVAALRTACQRLEQDHKQRLLQQDEAERRHDMVADKLSEITLHILNTSALLSELVLEGEAHGRAIEELITEKTRLRGRRGELLSEETTLRQQRRELSDRQHQHDIRRRDARHQLETLAQRIEEEYQQPLHEIAATGISAIQNALKDSDERPPTDEGEASAEDAARVAQVRSEMEERVNRLRRKLRTMGSVDTDSLNDLDDLERRYALQSAQLQDLIEAKSTLEDIVRRINTESKRLFVETFEEVRGHFQHLFRKAFGGGDGDIVLEDPEDVLECGIEIAARPPGKELKSLSLMSGGEKALTAFALLLALFKTRPSPYCLLDEVDAPLDEANVGRLGALLEEFKGSTQFIVITHKKPTMTIADVLYGVTMEQSGVSKRMSVRFDDVSENGEFSAPSESRQAA